MEEGARASDDGRFGCLFTHFFRGLSCCPRSGTLQTRGLSGVGRQFVVADTCKLYKAFFSQKREVQIRYPFASAVAQMFSL